MARQPVILGFHKLTVPQRVELLPIATAHKQFILDSALSHPDIAGVVNDLSENTIAQFQFPFGIAPNMVINGRNYFVPLVTEESSVVAAIAKATKFWSAQGGFKATVVDTEKKGQIHFFWYGANSFLTQHFLALKQTMLLAISPLVKRMANRGGGISALSLIDCTEVLDNYWQIDASFKTADAMGANFINSCLEQMAEAMHQYFSPIKGFEPQWLDINMAILSNYTPNCRVVVTGHCAVDQFEAYGKELGIANFSQKFINAINIARVSVSRAVTHNKGIFNGIDAVTLATANDWRAIEACGHAYAGRNGQYAGLTNAIIENNEVVFGIDIAFAAGTVGGVTQLHPMAKMALQILGNPNAGELMQIMAATGLASNFSAVTALISTGIQKGHMKMHLVNILRQHNATEQQIASAQHHFSNKTVTHAEVVSWLNNQ